MVANEESNFPAGNAGKLAGPVDTDAIADSDNPPPIKFASIDGKSRGGASGVALALSREGHVLERKFARYFRVV
jgi:hypothetical protein